MGNGGTPVGAIPVDVNFDGAVKMCIDPKFLVDYLNVLEPDANLYWYLPGGDKMNPTMICLASNTAEDSYMYIIRPNWVSGPVIPAAHEE